MEILSVLFIFLMVCTMIKNNFKIAIWHTRPFLVQVDSPFHLG